MIHPSPPQPVPFYGAGDQPYTSRDNCRGQVLDGLFFPTTHFPPFVIIRDPSANDIFDVHLRRQRDLGGYGTNVDMIEVRSYNGKDYLFGRALPTVLDIMPGVYRYEIEDGEDTYYSEWFYLSDCTDDMLRVSYSDTCLKTDIPWQVAPSGFELFWYMKTGLGPSVVTSDEEVEDDGETERVVSVRTVTRTTISDLLPDHMLHVLHALKHHATVIITDRELEHSDVVIGTISGTPVSRGCKQVMAMQVAINGEWRKGCCDGSSGAEDACPVDDAKQVSLALVTEDETWFDANSTSGQEGLRIDTGSGFALVYVNGGFNYFPILGKFYMAALLDDGISTNVLYYITGTMVNQPTANLVNPELFIDFGADTAVIATQSFITGRYAQIQYSTDDGLNWNIERTVTEEELQAGVTEVDTRPTGIWRVRYYTHGCEYGYSPILLGNCCSQDDLTISNATTYTEVNDTYTQSGSYDGKYNYAVGLKNVYWSATNSRWINSVNGVPKYASPNDTEYPCQATVWYPVTAEDDELTTPEAIRVCGSVVAE